MDSLASLGTAYRILLYVLSPFVLVALGLTLVRAYTAWSYYNTLKQFTQEPQRSKQTVTPPQIPYTLPWLGNSLSFLAPSPGAFWDKLFAWHPRTTGVCTLLLGGKKTHILFSPVAVQAMFKDRKLTRDVFEEELFTKVFQFEVEQVRLAQAGKHFEHEMNAQYLTKHDRVNELTAHFTKVLGEVLDKDADAVEKMGEIGIYHWLRDRMFTASTVALMGEKLLQMYPDYCEDFFKFDIDFLSFFFELPSFMMGDAITNRDKIISKLKIWSAEMHKQSGGTPVDPEGPAWEPLFGSRLNRARQLDYKNRQLNKHSGAGFDLGITFGLASNVIPATGWMLMHILSPSAEPTLLPRVLVEVDKATKSDGTLDIPTLVSQPLLQSIWTETLRLYTDVLVTRNAEETITLPLDEDGKRQVTYHKGDYIFAPSWLGHRDAKAWSGGAPFDTFFADRFLTKDSKTGAVTYSLTGTAGKFFPFGGGKTICPGRVFAKQEGLGALAMVLSRFEFEVTGFLDINKKETKSFPGFPKVFAGSGTLAPGGDVKVKVKRWQ